MLVFPSHQFIFMSDYISFNFLYFFYTVMFIVYFVIVNDDFPEQALPLETYLNVAKKKEYG